MYYDFISGKFVVENRAHFLCKDLTVLPNGVPVIVTEMGELYALLNRSKHLGNHHDSDYASTISGGSTEMVRLADDD
jgi:hypothetical protein